MVIPIDLRSKFGGSREFHISLKDVRNSELELVSIRLKQITHQIFHEVRSGMKSLELEDMKLILRTEVKKSIDHSHHVHLGTNEFNQSSRYDSLKTISQREEKFRREVNDDLGGYEKELDSKLEGILKSLDIEFKPSSLPYKQLRRSFVKLYSLRFDWIKDLINESGRTDDDFRRDADEKLRMELFPELQSPPSVQVQVGDQILNPVIENFTPEPPQPYRVERPLSSLQSTPISKVIEKYFEDKISSDIRNKSQREMKHSLSLLMEGLGDIPLGSVDVEKCSNLKTQIKKLPRNRKKLPQYREKSFHELVQMNIKESDRISVMTFNKHIQFISSFMNWGVIHGYCHVNPFKGMKQKIKVRPRDQRDRFSDQELKIIFNKQNYLHFTEVQKGRIELFWVPLISIFSGMRMGEITPLYLDNIKEIRGNHREKRWCFDIVEEPDRPDKKLKTLSSRRIVPIHDTLIDLGLIELIKILKDKNPDRKRLFEELPYGENSYNRNITRFFNQRYLPKLGLKTDRKNFHSLRHTVSDHLKQKGVDVNYINELLGHTSGNIDLDRYGKGYNPDILFNKCVKKIVYETSHTRGIDFKCLRMDWNKLIK